MHVILSSYILVYCILFFGTTRCFIYCRHSFKNSKGRPRQFNNPCILNYLGLSHSRVRNCIPTPHVRLHSLYSDQDPQFPSTCGEPLSTHSPLIHHCMREKVLILWEQMTVDWYCLSVSRTI